MSQLKEWLTQAESGDAYAQFQLGWVYAEGTGVEKNFTEALYWWRQAADKGHPESQHVLGRA